MDNDNDRPCLPDGCRFAMIIRYHGLVKLINYCVTIANRVAIQRDRKKKPVSASMVESVIEIHEAKDCDPEQQAIQAENVRIVGDAPR